MPMRIEDKKEAVEELNKIASEATSAIAADYHGTSVSELLNSLDNIQITIPQIIKKLVPKNKFEIIYFENVFLNNINKIMVSIIIGTTVSSVLIILKISAPVPARSLFV